MARARGGASGTGPSVFGRLVAWVMHHGHSSLATLGRLYSAPMSSAMTVAVIGIALALPAGLYVLVDNTRQLGGAWESALEISVFMEPGAGDARASDLAAELRAHDRVAAVRVITASESLEEFREHSGFGTALDILRENPLPAVLVVTPDPSIDSPGRLQPLAEELRGLPGVELVQLDTQWLQRLFALLEILERAILVISILLAAAVIITVGNTIRLDIQGRRDEIEVTKLIGGSDAFIRRPFLYSGFWYGICGGVTAWLLVTAGLLLLSGPVARLAGLYSSTYALSGPGFSGLLFLGATGALLGWLGSWVAVGRHLDEIEPS